VSLASVWDAMASETHHQGWLKPNMVDYLHSQIGRMFDPGLVESLIELLSEAPEA
jgi:response regulator RpfG family c-di-GMP phosphodiesterase